MVQGTQGHCKINQPQFWTEITSAQFPRSHRAQESRMALYPPGRSFACVPWILQEAEDDTGKGGIPNSEFVFNALKPYILHGANVRCL